MFAAGKLELKTEHEVPFSYDAAKAHVNGQSSAAAAEGYHVAVLQRITLQCCTVPLSNIGLGLYPKLERASIKHWSGCLSNVGACLYPTLERVSIQRWSVSLSNVGLGLYPTLDWVSIQCWSGYLSNIGACLYPTLDWVSIQRWIGCLSNVGACLYPTLERVPIQHWIEIFSRAMRDGGMNCTSVYNSCFGFCLHKTRLSKSDIRAGMDKRFYFGGKEICHAVQTGFVFPYLKENRDFRNVHNSHSFL